MKREIRNNRRKFYALTLVASAVTIALQGSAATHYVSQTSPSPAPPYSTFETAAHNIQDAVDVASDGDTVLVEPGDYGVTNQITVTNAVRLQSTDGTSQTFLTAFGSVCLSISNALAVADGFTLQPGAGDPRGANLFGGTIQNCNFTNFTLVNGDIIMSGGTVSNVVVEYLRAPDGVAVYCSNAGLITDCLILAKPGYTHNANGGAVALINSRLQNSLISGGPNAGPSKGVAVSAISSTIVGCTISNNFNFGKGGGAYLQDSLMDRCIVTGNTAAYGSPGYGGGGIFETNSVIRNSLIVGNYATVAGGDTGFGGLGGGVYMQGGALVNCTVSKNSAFNFPDAPGAGGGIYVEGNGAVTNSIIYFNSFSGESTSSSNWNAGSAIFDHSCTAPDPGGAGNITQDPQFVDMTNGNFHLASTSPCIDAGTNQSWMTGAQDLDGNPRIRGATVDIGTYENPSPSVTHYVSQTSPNPTAPYSTPATAAHNIQDAVDVASDGDAVLVEQGDYGLTNQVTVTKGILLQGASGPGQTFLTALTSHIWCLGISNSLAVVDGLSLRNQYDPYPGGLSGGAFLAGGTIQNCTFSNFYVGKPGGAIIASGGVISNSIVTYRRYGGGDGATAVYGDGALITDSMVLGIQSSGSGGGLSLTNSRLQNSVISGVLNSSLAAPGVALTALSSSVVGCTISNNFNIATGGGVHLEDSLMDRCVVTHNTGGGECSGGGGIFEINSVIRDSLITSNSLSFIAAEPSCGSYGGGVYMRGGSLVNCTVVGNIARVISNGTGGGGGVFAEQNADIINSIIYFNSADSVSSNWFNNAHITFYNSCSAPDPNAAGPANITQDPQFVDMTNGNYHLSASSPCIGAGRVQPWMTDAQDLDGNPRTTNGRVDIGAYQSGYPPPSTKLSIFRSGSNVILKWPSMGPSDIVLEKSSDLTTLGSWTPVVAFVTDDGTNNYTTLPATNTVQFFRRR